MERGDAPGRGARGGDGIQAIRPARARLTLAALALVAAALTAGFPVLVADDWERLAGVLGAAGVLLLLVGLVLGAAGSVPWGIAGLGAEYGVWLVVREGGVDDRAPLYGGALLLVAELAYWSLQQRGAAAYEAALTVRRLAVVVVGTIAAVVLGAALLAASTIEVGAGGVLLELAGVLGALGVLALVARLVWRERREAE